MIPGYRFWIAAWVGILLLGIAGLVAAVYWGRRTGWKNLDEVLRGCGTIAASLGMLLLLLEAGDRAGQFVGQVLLAIALVLFISAFVLGRRGGLRITEDDE